MVEFVQNLRLKGINISFTKPKSELVLAITQNKQLTAGKI